MLLKLHSCLVFCLLCSEAHIASAQQPLSRNTANVYFRSVNVFGAPITGFQITGFSDVSGVNLASRIRNGLLQDVSFGRYTVEAYKGGYRDFLAVVDVLGKDVVVTVCFESEAMEAPEGRILTEFSGRILHRTRVGVRDGRCKAVGVFLRTQYESLLSGTTLEFNFGLVAPGTYDLICTASSEIVLTKVLKVDGGSPPFVLKP